jgi:hypothetical protein
LVQGCWGGKAPAPLFISNTPEKEIGKYMTNEKKADGWIDELCGALCDPIIVFPSPWRDDLPEWVKPQITLERLITNMKVLKEGGVSVGDTEAMAYMFPKTMEAPMTEQWFRIYMYVCTQAMRFKKVEVPEDIKSESLSDYDMRELDDLKRWIYSKRVQHRKEKARAERQAATVKGTEKSKTDEKELEVVEVQPSFF